jgi:hypothetical protein
VNTEDDKLNNALHLAVKEANINVVKVRSTIGQTLGEGEFHDQGDNLKKEYYLLIVTETTNYVLRATNHRAANRPARGWLPEGRFVMPANYYPFSVP